VASPTIYPLAAALVAAGVDDVESSDAWTQLTENSVVTQSLTFAPYESRAMHPVETHAQLGALHPVGRMGEISDIVDAILYLESASFVTGEILHVDGGQSAGH
jgi:NAD(P)-dependent dehydrogenase (short-subunit alcohol dehydrogenase family)